MILRRVIAIVAILYSLLFLLSTAAQGQTALSSDPMNRSVVPTVQQKEGKSWGKMLWKGGMTRWGNGKWYLTMPSGYGDLVVMNFVDGYSYGPHAIVGHFGKNRSRWELEETVRYASARESWMAKGALRWFAPVEYGTMVELHGGRHTEDFDPDPVMDMSHSLMATGIFGWSHYKLLERTDVGVRTSFSLSNDLMLKGHLGWEKRHKMQNHKDKNFFGVHAQDNAPRVADSEGKLLHYLGNDNSEPYLSGRIDDQLLMLNLELNYLPGCRRMVYDDMTCRIVSLYPQLTFKVDAGAGTALGEGGSDFRYMTAEFRLEQQLTLARRQDRLGYMLSVGNCFKDGTIGLADWHHFDASRFWWQGSHVISHFALLDNYELSTDQWWIDVHSEWESDCMLLTTLTRNPDFLKEYVQFHAVKVPNRRFHYEFQYGVTLVNMLRLGAVLGWDNSKFRGLAFTMVLSLQQ